MVSGSSSRKASSRRRIEKRNRDYRENEISSSLTLEDASSENKVSRRRSSRKSSTVQRLQITHSPSHPSKQAPPLTLSTRKSSSSTTLTTVGGGGRKPTQSTTTMSTTMVTAHARPLLTLHSFNNGVISGQQNQPAVVQQQDHPGSTTGTVPMPIAINSVLKDIRDVEVDDILSANWTTPMAVTLHAQHRKLPLDSDIFTKAHTEFPWKDQGNILFFCEGGKIVRAHALLLNAILPCFVNDLMTMQTFLYMPCCSTSISSPNLPVFVKGVEPRCIERFLALLNRSMEFMTGREIMQLKKLVEFLHITELNIFFTNVGGGTATTDNNVNNMPTPVSTTTLLSSTPTHHHSAAGGIPNTDNTNISNVVGLMSLGNPPTPASPPVMVSPQSLVDQFSHHYTNLKESAQQPHHQLFTPDRVDSAVKERKKRASNTTGGNPGGISALDAISHQPTASKKVRRVATNLIQSPPPESAFTLGGMPPPRITVTPLTTLSRGVKSSEAAVAVASLQIEGPATKRRSARVKSEVSSAVQKQGAESLDDDEREAKRKRTVFAKGLRQATLSALKAGTPIRDIAARFDVDSKVINRWKNEEKRNGTDTVENAQDMTAAAANSVENDEEVAIVPVVSVPIIGVVEPSSHTSADLSSTTTIQQQSVVVPETPTIGFDSVLMSDHSVPVDYCEGNTDFFAQPLDSAQVLALQNMQIAIQNFAQPEHTKDTTGGGANSTLAMQSSSTTGLNLVVGPSNSVQLEQLK